MASKWVDNQGGQWRFSAVAGDWQKLNNSGVWVTTALPSGGLQRNDLESIPSTAIIVETMGPEGPPGPTGPGVVGGTAVLSDLGIQDGVNDSFPLPPEANPALDLIVFRNGLRETPETHYTVVGGGDADLIVFSSPPLSDDVVSVIYQKVEPL